MNTAFPRGLLATAAALLLFGAAMHTSAFPRTQAAVAASNLASFFGESLKALWLIDSVTLLTLAVVFSLVAARPTLASGVVVALLALVPAATAALLYRFIGSGFAPAHLLLLAAVLAFVAGWIRATAA
jgi:hypothetical protein